MARMQRHPKGLGWRLASCLGRFLSGERGWENRISGGSKAQQDLDKRPEATSRQMALWGPIALSRSLPFAIMIVAVALICAFPGIATWLPKLLMG
jgi:hypothetical protein